MKTRRRRPLLRASMVGGAAYHAGKEVVQGREQGAARAPAPAPAELAELKDTGALSREEFDAPKAQLLGS
jgi:hypothetical protein